MRPHIDGSTLSLFVGVIESTDSNYTSVWNAILSAPGLIFATLGYDERVELDDSKLSADAFPWRDWPMVLGALRSSAPTNTWTIYEGPEIRWFRR